MERTPARRGRWSSSLFRETRNSHHRKDVFWARGVFMKTIKGPAIFLAQFAGDAAPFNNLREIAEWAAHYGYKGLQIPTWDTRLFDLDRAAESGAYCDDVRGVLADAALEVTELSTHLQGQLIAVHPAYDVAFDGFAPAVVHGNPAARQEWA